MPQVSPEGTSAPVDQRPLVTPLALSVLVRLTSLRGSIPVLWHIPKRALDLAAGKRYDIVDLCVNNNGVSDCRLFFLSHTQL